MAQTATGMEIEGMETGMVTGIGGRWKRAWRRAVMDDGGGHATGMHEGVDGDGRQRRMATGIDEGVADRRYLRRNLREQQPHETWLTTTVTAQASTLSLLAYAHLTRPVHAFLYPETRATLAQHNYAHPIMHPPSTGTQHNYVDVTSGLEPLHKNEMCPRAIHYAGDIVPLFPRLPSLLCLLFYNAFSHHIYVFLFVSVNPAAEMATQEEMATQDDIATQQVMATQEEPAEYTL